MMIFTRFCSALVLFGLHASARSDTIHTKFISKRDPCVALAKGWEAIDDSPAINDALKACGNGGTIILPADQYYSIRSPIDFTPCRNCEVQIEGQLIVARGQWDYWRLGFNNGSVPAFFIMSNVKGVRIHSVTGKGAIDGNAVEYYTTRFDSGFVRTISFVEITDSSSDIIIENLAMKNVMYWHRFIRAQKNSTNLTFRNLTLTMEEQWGMYPRNELDAAGIELGVVDGVSISDITIAFSSWESRAGPVGICIPFDIGAHNVDVRRVTCTGAWGGVLVSIGSIDMLLSYANAYPPSLIADTISNIYVSDLTFSGSIATGILDYFFNGYIHNVTWDGVTVLGGDPGAVSLCYLKIHNNTPWVPNCWAQLAATVTDVWLKRFRGKGLVTPKDGSWDGGSYTNKTVIRIQFADWAST